jgi:Family of unknown function (DUF6529)
MSAGEVPAAGAPAKATKSSWLVLPVLIGALVSVALGVYGADHKGKSIVFEVSGFENLARAKAWMAAVVGVLVIVQLLSALVVYGKIKALGSPSWIAPLHRWSGRLAFGIAIVIGVFCLYGIGFQTHTPRTAVHSALGCLFFGAFTTKMLVLTKPGLKGWVLPVVGGVVFTVLAGATATSSLWYFATQ